MQNRTRNLFILIIPFFLMILINEYSRVDIKWQGYNFKDVSVMNSSKKTTKECTWNCQNNTAFCKSNHVKYLKSYFSYIDPIYFGMIKFLKSTGDYQVANIIFLMFIWPLVMFVLIINSLSLIAKIKNLNSR